MMAQHSLLLSALALFEAVQGHHLTAVSKHAKLKPRFPSFEPSFDGHSLMYADASSGFPIERPFSAEVGLQPKLPAVNLDDLDEHLRQVSCSSEHISVRFHSPTQMRRAESAWAEKPEFLAITSELGCADHGMHQPFIVSMLESDVSSHLLRLSKRPVSFKECTNRFTIDLGHQVGERVKPPGSSVIASARKPTLQPRQEGSSFAQTAQILTGSPTVNYPSATPTQSPVGATASADLSHSVVNKTLIPLDSSMADAIPGQHEPEHVTLTCANCSTAGTIEVISGFFTMGSGDDDNAGDLTSVEHVVEDGYLELAVNGMSANMSMELSLEPGFSVAPVIPLLPISRIPPIKIGGFLTFAPILGPVLPINFTLATPATISTGFTLSVPDNSTVVLDIGSIGDSSISGFNTSTITPLPFSLDAPSPAFNITMSFEMRVGLDASVGRNSSVHVGGNVGAHIDVPKITTQVKTLDNATESCDPVTPGAQSYSGLYNIIPSVEVGGGYYWGLNVENYDRQGGMDWDSSDFALPTSCLKFDAKASGSGGLIQATAMSDGGRSAGASGGAWLVVAGVLIMSHITVL